MQRLIGIGKPKDKKVPATDLNSCIVNVDKKSEELEKKVNQCDADLKKLRDQLKGMREGSAKTALKQKLTRILQRKKAFDTQLENLRQQSFNMEQVSTAVQTTKDTKVVVGAMQAGVSQLKKELKKTDIDKIEDLQDDMSELLEESEEIQQALGRDYNMPDIDENELEAELEALGEEIASDNDSSYLDHAATAPNAPNRDLSRPQPPRMADDIPVDEFGLPQVSL